MTNEDIVPARRNREIGLSSSAPRSCVLLLLGSERSGTTFVQETLNKFYPVSPGNESQWVISAWKKANKQNIATIDDQVVFLKSVFADWYFANKANYHQVFFDSRQFLQHEPFDFSKFVEQVFRHIAKSEENQWVLNKTCMYCEHMPVVDRVFHCPKVIHLVRDGRDVGLSLIKTKAWGPISPYGAASWWSNRVSKFQQYADKEMQGRYLEVKYEDLISDPGGVFESITRFYEIFDEDRHSKLLQFVRTKSDNNEKWRTQFTLGEVKMFERVAGNTLKSNGYALTNGELKPLSKSSHALWRLYEFIFSRISFYPLWFRSLRVINRLVGLSPTLQQKFYRSAFFANHFNWNKNMGISDDD